MKKMIVEYRVLVEVEIDENAYEAIKDDAGMIDEYAPDLKIKAKGGEVLNHEIVEAVMDEDNEVLYKE